MLINERIDNLRYLMLERKIDAYIIPTDDNHQSEYVGEYFKCRQFISGFTGSAGTVVVTADMAGLWTDGRYFIQAEKQLRGSEIKLFKMGNPGVPSISEYLRDNLKKGSRIGFNGTVYSLTNAKELINTCKIISPTLVTDDDLVGKIWKNRPPMSSEPVFMLNERLAGESIESKLERVRNVMKENDANCHILSSIDDICWLLNIRGNDVKYSPLVLSYALIREDSVDLFIDDSRIDRFIKEKLANAGVVFKPYDEVYDEISKLSSSDRIMYDPDRINYALYSKMRREVVKIEKENPEVLFKSIKNDTEIENIKNAHIKDGVAHTKFMRWLKTQYNKIDITEMSAADKLIELRCQQGGYLWPSFSPICAFREHAAMMHYSASEDSNATLSGGHLFLTDTGGNYYEGSTDITRTIALGEIDETLKKHFTTVVRSMINLSKTNFLYGCRGYNLDIMARGPIWDLGIDFKCGTGHGVGYLLNIHEAPAGFRWNVTPEKHETHPLEPNMIITNEPGIYIEGSHGIRIENELIVRKNGVENEFGQFMCFEPVTYCPIDLDAIDKKYMNPDEVDYLNRYHKLVFEKVSPHLDDEEVEWLKKYTREI